MIQMFLLSTSNAGVSLVSAQGVAMACSWRWPQCHRGLVQCCFNFRISKFKPFHPVFIPIPMLYPMLYPLDHLQHLWPAEALNFLKLVRMRCHPQSHAQSMSKGQLWRPKRGKTGIMVQQSHLFSTIITGLFFNYGKKLSRRTGWLSGSNHLPEIALALGRFQCVIEIGLTVHTVCRFTVSHET